MRIQISVKGESLVVPEGVETIDALAVPRVGEYVTTDALNVLAERLGIDDPQWEVVKVDWYFQKTAEGCECDAQLWVTCYKFKKYLNDWLASEVRSRRRE